MKNYGTFVVLVLLAGAAGLVMLGNRDDRADLSSVMEMVSDAQQDIAKTPNTLLRLSDPEENQLGLKLLGDRPFRGGELPALASYVAAVAGPLLAHVKRPGIAYRFHVIDSDGINAFAMPGGQIFVLRGLIDFVANEAELASIIGHEIAHVDLRHCVDMYLMEVWMKKMGRTRSILKPGDILVEISGMGALYVTRLMQSGYRKFQEYDADAEGLNFITRAGYQPAASASAMKRIQDKFDAKGTKRPAPANPIDELARATESVAGEYFRSHPPTDERVQRLRAKAGSGGISEAGYRGMENLRRRIARSQQEFPNER